MKNFFVAAAALCALASPVRSQGIAEITVTGSEVEARIELASGVSADLTISFEQVVGLGATASALGMSASQIDPNDFDLVNRLKSLDLMTIPSAFPVLLTIEPPANGPLSFSGVVSIGLHTHDLNYTFNSPLRLFAATAGGSFHDITNMIGMGSYRTGGSKGGFSEFIIVADSRSHTSVIDSKFARLQAVLDDYCTEIESSVLSSLQSHLDSAWSWYSAGDLVSAAKAIDDLASEAKANSGEAIPSTWRSGGDLANVAGELRARAATLRFSINLAASS